DASLTFVGVTTAQRNPYSSASLQSLSMSAGVASALTLVWSIRDASSSLLFIFIFQSPSLMDDRSKVKSKPFCHVGAFSFIAELPVVFTGTYPACDKDTIHSVFP